MLLNLLLASLKVPRHLRTVHHLSEEEIKEHVPTRRDLLRNRVPAHVSHTLQASQVQACLLPPCLNDEFIVGIVVLRLYCEFYSVS
jgi:hypothetical protein